MSNYTKTTDFEAKDSLPSGDSGKIIRGSEFETEFDNIATAIASKSDANNPTFTGTVTIDGLTVNGNTVLGNAASDTVTVTADIASNLLPSADDTYNLGAVGAEWNDLYVDGVAYIDTINGFAATGDVNFGDNNKAQFGAGNDLQIFHDGSNSRIKDNGTGGLYVQGSSFISLTNASATETYVYAAENGAVQLKYDNATKLATTSTGIDVTGVITTDGMTTSADINFGDNDKAVFGAGSDLQLYHDGSNSHIKDAGSGGLRLSANQFRVYNAATDELSINAVENGTVELYYDNAKKLETTNTGIDVTGFVNSDGIVHTGDTDTFIKFIDNRIYADNGGIRVLDFEANSSKINSAGFVFIQTGTPAKNRIKVDNNGDISFYEDTGTTAKFFWDSSAERLGLGTSSPSQDLEIFNGSTGAGIRLAATATAYWDIERDPTSGHLTFTDDGAGTVLTVGQDGNVGIGTSSPSAKGHIAYTTAATANKTYGLIINGDDSGTVGESSSIFLSGLNATARGASIAAEIQSSANDHDLIFATSATSAAPSERMRIDSSGNLLVGKTSPSSATVGFQVGQNGFIAATRASSEPLVLNRLTSDGPIASFRKDGTTVGSIGTNVSRFYIHGSYGSGSGLRFDNASIRPATSTGASSDDTTDLGSAAARFDDIYATNSTIQTSDRNEKQNIEALSDAEQRVAVACKGLLRKFRWIDSVEEKGDEARIHFGIVAQDLQDAFTAEGLDAGRYAMFISTTWTDEETGEERTRMGVRYSELLAFIIAAI